MLAGSVVDYVGRQADLLAFDDATAAGEAQLRLALVYPGSAGALTTGIQKLVQRFLLELLTDRGSLQYLPFRGTSFLMRLRAGYVRTSQELFSEFTAAELLIRSNLRLEEIATDPLDERYRNAALLQATLDGDTAQLKIQITSQAGESRQIVYPLRTTAI